MIKIDFHDPQGIRRRVGLPHEGADPREGVPLSLPIEQLYGHMPPDFVVRLSEALYARGLIEPEDFLKPGAPELTRTALLDVVKRDALDIISLAKTFVR